jgi:hypothetical protein
MRGSSWEEGILCPWEEKNGGNEKYNIKHLRTLNKKKVT